jgi:hypothetical protein
LVQINRGSLKKQKFSSTKYQGTVLAIPIPFSLRVTIKKFALIVNSKLAVATPLVLGNMGMPTMGLMIGSKQ